MKRELEFDVVVAGGGPAGINAAIASGRTGAKTLLIERYGFLGGMSTIALVYPWMTFHTSSGKQVIKGIAQEIVERLIKQGGSPGHLRDTVGFTYTVTPYHPEKYKLLALEMLEEAGVEVLVHSFADQVEVEGIQITSIKLTTKSGPITVSAKRFVDTTGDADIAFLSGAPCFKGRDHDHKTQPMTMKFRMRGVDLAKVKAAMKANPRNFYKKTPIDELDELPLTGVQGFYKEWNESGVPINRDQVLFFAGPEEDEVLVNCTRVQGLDGTDVFDLSQGEKEGRKQVLMMAEFLQRKIPGFEKASISAVGTQIGIRETRRIDGQYALTIEDVVSGRKFEDTIALSGYPIDIHDPTGKGVQANDIQGDGSYGIPYRCLLPKQIENLLVAGRCISTTHEALATTRLTPSAMATGQAAGTAAALSITENVPPKNLNINKLKAILLEDGAVL
ncbi:FAD dependent oxidoreductase [Bacillus oleivorans]|uniref:FAD dependent oxidoreductase n=1 Tax=Bacillus oleivorans TaxID=1448271 RepID=A0A285D801_9BACI|nr:FAD-dependent oxidoreductase [Bacillus oleivorans]SNX75486.1 FAD dependent oxidoreductase [Bacillus oleivorans]